MPIVALHVAGYARSATSGWSWARSTSWSVPTAAGKTNLDRALSLLAEAAAGRLARALADKGGMPSVLWAGERGKAPVRMTLGVELDELAYELSCGLVPPPPLCGGSAFNSSRRTRASSPWPCRCRSSAGRSRRGSSPGALHYLCLLAALLSPRPPALPVLNEPDWPLRSGIAPITLGGADGEVQVIGRGIIGADVQE